MAKESKSGNISKRGSISEGTMKKGGVNTPPTSSRPSKPTGQAKSSEQTGSNTGGKKK